MSGIHNKAGAISGQELAGGCEARELTRSRFWFQVIVSFVRYSDLFLVFSPHLCYHMEKHYISGMSDSNAASAVSVFLLHSGKSQCF